MSQALLLYAIQGVLRVATACEAWIVPPGLPSRPAVLDISGLLRALILALLAEPVLYDEKGRGGLLAGLILDELARARHLQLVIPMPRANGYDSASAFTAAFRKAMGVMPGSLARG